MLDFNSFDRQIGNLRQIYWQFADEERELDSLLEDGVEVNRFEDDNELIDRLIGEELY